MTLDTLVRLAALVGLLSIPWLLSAFAAVFQAWQHRLLLERGGTLVVPARAWVEALARRSSLPTRFEVHPSLAEGYFPHADTVGMSPGAAAGARPVHRAVAAHELGHAAILSAFPMLRAAAPGVRLLADALPHAATASWVVAAIHGSPWMGWLGSLLVTASAGCWVAIVLDEAAASGRAWAWLRVDPDLGPADRHHATRALAGALAVYAVPALSWVALSLCSPWIARFATSGAPIEVAQPLFAGGLLAVLALPFLALHAGLVLTEAVHPEPVASAFHLQQRAERDSSWAFLAGLCVLVLAGSALTNGTSLAFEVCLTAALFVASGPASLLARSVLLIPAWILATWTGLSRWLPDDLAGPSGGAEDAPRALAGLWEHPPWFLRAARLTGLAWTPLVGAIAWIAWEQAS